MDDLWNRIAAATEHRRRNLYSTAVLPRELFLREFSWAIPSPKAIAAIKQHVGDRRLLEVGAGLGLWARLLSEAGIDVIATDLKRSPHHANFAKQPTWFEVEKRGAISAVRHYRDCAAIMFCWPPYAHKMAYYALREFQGDRLVYIGEGDGGCTGDEAFHQLLEKRWLEEETVAIPQWPTIHDDLTLYRRR